MITFSIDRSGHIKPDQALAMACNREKFSTCLLLEQKDERVMRYLRGETISYRDEELDTGRGDVLILVDSHPLGFGRIMPGNRINNRLNPAFRLSC